MTTGEPITVRAEHPAEWIAALPVIVGYELTDRSTLTFTRPDGVMVCVAAVPHAASAEQITAILAEHADSIRAEGVVATWTTVHGLDPANAWVRSQVLADAVTAAGLPRPDPDTQFAVAGAHAWPVTRSGGITPQVGWDLSAHHGVRDRFELLLGSPADSKHAVGADLAAAPGPLRDAIAAALPGAAGDPQARTAPHTWRQGAVAETLAAVTDPRPWTGDQAARALLAMSDSRVLSRLLAETVTAQAHSVHAPDTGRLAELVRAAPPGLVAGPATLLAGRLAAQGLTSARARTAASLAVADRPDATTALALLAALDRGSNPRTVLTELTARSPDLDAPVGVLFTAGDGHWPDPLTTPAQDVTALAEFDDPLAAPAAGEPTPRDRPDGPALT